MINPLHKLQSRRGSSMIFAIVAMGIAVMVSAVIIYAAENNIRRIRADQEAEQARLALNSAAAVIRDEIAGDVFTSTVDMNVTRDSEASGAISIETNSVTSESNTYTEVKKVFNVEQKTVKYSTVEGSSDTRSTIEKTVYTMASTVLKKTSTLTKADATKALTSTFRISADNMPDVNVVLTMEPGSLMDETDDTNLERDSKKYYITAVLSVDDYASEKIYMTFMSNDPVEKVTSTRTSGPVEKTVSVEGGTKVLSEETFATKKSITVKWQENDIVVNIIGD